MRTDGPWIHLCLGTVRLHKHGLSNPRLSNIVKGCPCTVPDHIGKSLHIIPDPVDLHGEAFRTQNHPLGEQLPGDLIMIFHIVIAHHIQKAAKGLRAFLYKGVCHGSRRILLHTGRTLGIFSRLAEIVRRRPVIKAAPIGTQTVGDQTGGIQASHKGSKLHGNPVSVVHAAPLRDLVARGPDQNRGMAPVP